MIIVPSPRRTRLPSRHTGSYDELALVIGVPVSAALVLFGAGPPIVRLIVGLFVLIALPVMLVNAKINWPRGIQLHESLLYSLALVVLGLMVGGLFINEALPFLGVARPLDRVPVVASLLIALVSLGLWRPGRWRLRDGLSADNKAGSDAVAGRRDQIILVGCTVLVVGSIAGPIRLNNGLGGGLTAATLVLAAILMVALFAWRRTLAELTIALTIFLLSLAMLFITSMRGWNITGHDIQREYGMFQLAMDHGIWNIGAYQDAYNACLSITILPTIVERTTSIPDLYVFKVVFQLLFALCAVLIYLIARRFASKSVALIGVIYFLPFPVYFSEMPYLNRQEVAFFFLGVAVLLMTNRELTIKVRRTGFVLLGVGVLLSHYSTTYVLLCVLTIAWAVAVTVRIVRNLTRRRLARHGRQRHRRVEPDDAPVVNWAVILMLALLTFLWVGPLTHTASELDNTLGSTVRSLVGDGDGPRSSSTSFSILGGAKESPEVVLKNYRDDAIKQSEQRREAQENYPLAEIDKYPTPLMPFVDLPLSGAGEAAQQIDIDVPAVKHTVAAVLARITQLFIGLGVVLAWMRRARGFKPTSEFVYIATACLVMVALNILLPVVSTKYDVGRTFIEGLFWLAPFWAVGSIQAFGWLGRLAAIRIALAIAIVFFLLSANVISQSFGGEPPTIQLNNSGYFYDKYYVQVEDIAAIRWLQHWVEGKSEATVQAETFTGIYSYSDVRPDPDGIFPALIRKDAYVFVTDATTERGAVTVFIDGDLVSYRYPMDFLDNNKSLIYSSDGARIYR
jgi:uncharacterized membrane protein